MHIRNVEQGQGLLGKNTLATKGVFTCVGVLVLLNDNYVFLTHVDSAIFDPDENKPLVTVLNIIKYVMNMLDDCSKSSLIEDVLIIGGINNEYYRELNNCLWNLRRDYSTILHKSTMNIERCSMFIEKIKYHNLCVNMIETPSTVDDISKSTWITDISIICDRSCDPPVIAICKYIGTEEELNGDNRSFDPTIIHLFDLILNQQHLFIFPVRSVYPFVMHAIDYVKTNIEENLPNRDSFKDLAEYVMKDLIGKIED